MLSRKRFTRAEQQWWEEGVVNWNLHKTDQEPTERDHDWTEQLCGWRKQKCTTSFSRSLASALSRSAVASLVFSDFLALDAGRRVGLGQVVGVLLVGGLREGLVAPEVGGQVAVGLRNGVERSFGCGLKFKINLSVTTALGCSYYSVSHCQFIRCAKNKQDIPWRMKYLFYWSRANQLMTNSLTKERLQVRKIRVSISSAASPKMLDFRQITLFCLGYRLAKHNMTIRSENLGSSRPLQPHLVVGISLAFDKIVRWRNVNGEWNTEW